MMDTGCAERRAPRGLNLALYVSRVHSCDGVDSWVVWVKAW